MLLNINHTTEYKYSEPHRMIVQSHRLYPSECTSQTVSGWEVEVADATFGSYFYDGAGDRIRTMSIEELVDLVTIRVSGQIETTDQSGVFKSKQDTINPYVYLRSSAATEPGKHLRQAATASIDAADNNLLNRAHAMTSYINETIAYSSGTTDNSFTAEQALAQGHGVCQDQTQCLIALARINNIPARYVTGYLHTDSQGLSHDASHAWAELYISDLGWVGFDATNACCPDQRYVRIGSGIDAEDAALIRGVSRGVGQESMHISVEISSMQQ